MDITDEVMHDWLLQRKPENASHDVTKCAFCAVRASTEEKNVPTEPTLTQEQHLSLLESAVSDAVTTAKTEVDAEILHLNELLEEAKATIATQVDEIASHVAASEARNEAERLEALANERVLKVAEVASFSDDQIKSRRSDWAEMSEEAFGKYVVDLSTAAKAALETGDDDKLPKTEFDGTRETAGDAGSEMSVVKTFFTDGLHAAARS